MGAFVFKGYLNENTRESPALTPREREIVQLWRRARATGSGHCPEHQHQDREARQLIQVDPAFAGDLVRFQPQSVKPVITVSRTGRVALVRSGHPDELRPPRLGADVQGNGHFLVALALRHKLKRFPVRVGRAGLSRVFSLR